MQTWGGGEEVDEEEEEDEKDGWGSSESGGAPSGAPALSAEEPKDWDEYNRRIIEKEAKIITEEMH